MDGAAAMGPVWVDVGSGVTGSWSGLAGSGSLGFRASLGFRV